MVEVYKTNVGQASEAGRLVELLLKHFPDCKINFDLQDCDKILRVEGEGFAPERIAMLVHTNGFMCNVLE
ncbi:MAG TPA: hypothetical protein VEV15_03215 [Flavisolibacter sp.]|nr:hypothetical protein [Flavisolibacter sp.]